MSKWAKDEVDRIVATDDLHISPFRDDGKTHGTPTWIWSVVADGALYVRAYTWQNSRWYQAVLRQKAGRITAAGHDARGCLRAGRGIHERSHR